MQRPYVRTREMSHSIIVLLRFGSYAGSQLASYTISSKPTGHLVALRTTAAGNLPPLISLDVCR